APGHNGLLIAGLGHFERVWPNQFQPPPPENIAQRLERAQPGSVHVIFPHIGFGAETSALESYLLDWPIPSLVSLRTTWLGELGAALHFDNFPPPPAGVEFSPLKPGFTLGHLADTLI
ncbi:MAG: hypothetical protein ABIO73_13835, partial [Polaromonas sp.]